MSCNENNERKSLFFSEDEPVSEGIRKMYRRVVKQLADLADTHGVDRNDVAIHFALLISSAAELSAFCGSTKELKCIGCIANFNGECAADDCNGRLIGFADGFGAKKKDGTGIKLKSDDKFLRKQYYEGLCKAFKDDSADNTCDEAIYLAKEDF